LKLTAVVEEDSRRDRPLVQSEHDESHGTTDDQVRTRENAFIVHRRFVRLRLS
jgi:hypothetical protein